jgi:integrase
MVLDDEQIRTLVQGFKGTVLFPIVAVAAFTGARRNEILALRWDDLDIANNTLRIERAVEETLAHGLRVKAPKTERGKRTIKIDDELLSLLVAERERHLRIVAGVSDGAPVDLSLVKLPAGAFMFPNAPPRGGSFSFTRLRNPRVVTAAFVYKATSLGFPGLRLHDLRGSHETLLLDRGVPVHVVAARCGHDPAVRSGPTPSAHVRPMTLRPTLLRRYQRALCGKEGNKKCGATIVAIRTTEATISLLSPFCLAFLAQLLPETHPIQHGRDFA